MSNLLKDNEVLMAEYNFEKNKNIDVNSLVLGSHKKVWWKCEKGHEWETSVETRNKGSRCPYCSNRRVLKGYNDLSTINPNLAKEWNYEKNGNLKPDMIIANNEKKVWWKCNKGHEWEALIVSRNRGIGCPYCAGQRILKGYNDLSTINPDLAKEWNYEKNRDLKPDMVAVNSTKKVWWKCEKGHEWNAIVYSRNKGNDCPYCAKELQTSFPEQALYFYIKKLFPDAINGDRHLNMELDVYIPSIRVAIEYDGIFWHRNSKSDEKKNKLCEENKILLLRIKENEKELKKINDYLKIIPCHYSDEGIKGAIEYVVNFLGKNIDVNLDKDRSSIYESFVTSQKEQSLSYYNPNLAKEWNYEKNGDLKPDMVTAYSGKKVWWRCSKGHEWQATVNNRNRGNSCPICNSQKELKGYNDLSTINPDLAKEWNYEKNGDLKPDMVMANSGKQVWWKCNKGHEWEAIICSRNTGNICPYCAWQKVLKGYNDLSTINSKLAKEWNYKKNNDLTPSEISANSKLKVWWKCNKGHEWEASVYNRNRGNSCPYCSGRQVISGYNDLLTINSELVKEWNYEKNGDLKPDRVKANSGKKVWWKCNKGHEWQATISNRNNGRDCPICRNKKLLKGYNDLSTVNPTLAKEWNYERNDNLKPDMVIANNSKKVWWKCNEGHEWEATIVNRNRGTGCPECYKFSRRKNEKL